MQKQIQKMCANCRHFLPAEKKQPVDPLQGNCLRNPPQVISFLAPPPVVGGPAQLQLMNVYPSIPGNSRPCGEWQPVKLEGAAND